MKKTFVKIFPFLLFTSDYTYILKNADDQRNDTQLTHGDMALFFIDKGLTFTFFLINT